MRPSPPTLVVSVISLYIAHSYFTRMRVPLRETWLRSIVKHDEFGPPIGELKRSHVLFEFLRPKDTSNNAFSITHVFSFQVSYKFDQLFGEPPTFLPLKRSSVSGTSRSAKPAMN